ncbi:SMODS domain-containing nucleotidyltransferase [Corynebacterium glutamicum]|uniref:DNA polymerase III subunit delta domain protein n=1 Tax=Corynebacterium glutamicum (strain R) TaxID=340322 RepID=A0AB72VFB3_CORGB|nr:nucleotidyltransferase [Corynebacterium glutamicum]BAQ21166.1 DNA polymerase III subunit delta domain protein [Corynebacterium glutamicum R]
MTARIGEFNDFLRDFVNLNQGRVNTLQQGVSTLDEFLSLKSSLTHMINGDVIPQGSFAHKTIIKPFTGNDFDADVLLPMEEQSDWAPRKYTIELQKALEASQYTEMTILGKRCVTINYANDFHIDVVPFVTRDDGLTYITHRTDDEFVRQDPVAFTTWIKEKSSFTNGHLIRVIRLVKYLRDRSSIEVPSVVLTTLLAERVMSFNGNEDYTNVATTFTNLIEDLRDYICLMSVPPFIDDRIGGNLADRVTQSGFDNLKSQVKTWASKARNALDASSNESIEAWQKLFGSEFGRSSNKNVSSGIIAATGAISNLKTYENSMAPGEQTLQSKFGIVLKLDKNAHMKVVGRFSPRSNGKGRPRQMSSNGDHVPIGRKLTFRIEDHNISAPYEIYWKVRNAGPEAARFNNFRGEIRKGGLTIEETSNFSGSHWVEAWIVKDGFAIATARQDVTIMPK